MRRAPKGTAWVEGQCPEYLVPCLSTAPRAAPSPIGGGIARAHPLPRSILAQEGGQVIGRGCLAFIALGSAIAAAAA